jgi:hypothetical protein
VSAVVAPLVVTSPIRRRRRRIVDPEILTKNRGKAPPAVLNYGRTFPKKRNPEAEVGVCSSCRAREGRQRSLHGHFGLPILCEPCLVIRKERVARNKDAYYAAPREVSFFDL